MKLNNYIILLVGESGAGKSYIADKLAEKYRLKVVQSYTTREPRHPGEKGHIFIKPEEVENYRSDMCAYSVYNGHEYFATNAQIDESDIYIIDKNGIKYFRENYDGYKKPVVVYLTASEETRKERISRRADVDESFERICYDRNAFQGVDYDYLFVTDKLTADEIANRLMNIMYYGVC